MLKKSGTSLRKLNSPTLSVLMSMPHELKKNKVSSRFSSDLTPYYAIKKCQGPDMARLVHGCLSSSFSCSKSLCVVCWCLSVFVFRCGGCCSGCCSCCTLL